MDSSSTRRSADSEVSRESDPDFTSGEVNDISLISIWQTVLRRRAVVLAIMVLGVLVGVFIATRPRKFVASGTLQIRSGSANQYKVQALAGGEDSDDRIESEVTILQSNAVFLKVAEQLHLAADPAIMGKGASSKASLQDPVTQYNVLGAMRGMIKVERTPKTQIITVSCTSTSRDLTYRIVNTLMNQYIERIFETRYGSTQRAAKFLAQQLDDLKNQVLQDQQKLVDLQGKLGVVGFDDSHNLITTQLEELAHANQQADIARITAEARYRILQDERPDLVDGGPQMLASPSTIGSSLLQTLRSTRAQVATEYASVTEQFGPNYPEAKRLKAQLAESTAQVAAEQNRVLEQAKIAYEAAQRNQAMTNQALTQQEGEAFQKRNDMVNYQILLHDYQSSRTLYEGLMQRLREAGVVAGLESGDIELVDLATIPIAPTGHGPLTMLAISIALSMVLAFILAMLIEATDTSVRSVDDLERYIRLPVLAILPSYVLSSPVDVDGTDSRMEVLRAPQSHFTEGIRLLRSSLLLARADRRPKTIIFTSSMPQEGKSTVCSNEACVMAQNGTRVLLIDADLRRPSLHIKFGLPNPSGLSSVLTGTFPLEECLQHIKEIPTLDILTSGPIPPSPGALLASDSMIHLLERASREYDFILLDAPPSLTVSDAATLSELVDAVVLVVRSGMANKKMVLRVRNMLTRLGGNMPGFVFNGVDKRSTEYYDYKAQYGYTQYGYSQKGDGK